MYYKDKTMLREMREEVLNKQAQPAPSNYPKEFIDYTRERFGLECVDYQNDVCYQEWLEMSVSVVKDRFF